MRPGQGLIPFAAILAGGKARRMGRDKATIDLAGLPMIEWVWRRVSGLVERTVVVGGGPYLTHRGVPTIPDRYPGANSLGGIATALHHAAAEEGPRAWVLCVACDMPMIRPELVRLLWARRGNARVVVPRIRAGYEPLCALYRADVLDVMERQIARGDLRVTAVFALVETEEVGESDLRRADPELVSFVNLNRPEELRAVRRMVLARERGGSRGAA